MAHIKVKPPGQPDLDNGDRKPIVHVISGDTWRVSVNLYNPVGGGPATPHNTVVEVKLAETQFDKAIWEGEWFNGITPDENRAGLCYIDVPKELTRSLRRGSYMFSVRVSDLLKSKTVTEAEGSFLVEYKPTGEQHSIPYKDGTGYMANIPAIVEMLAALIRDFDAKKVDKNALIGTPVSISTVNDLRKDLVDIARVLGAKITWSEE